MFLRFIKPRLCWAGVLAISARTLTVLPSALLSVRVCAGNFFVHDIKKSVVSTKIKVSAPLFRTAVFSIILQIIIFFIDNSSLSFIPCKGLRISFVTASPKTVRASFQRPRSEREMRRSIRQRLSCRCI